MEIELLSYMGASIRLHRAHQRVKPDQLMRVTLGSEIDVVKKRLSIDLRPFDA